ncbi:Calx-beta domain-containing protein [Planctomycetota bacterium]
MHSNPSANHTIYLDFDGHVTEGTSWNSSYGVSSIVSPAFDPSEDGPSFNTAEQQRIQRVWQRVAEDFSPFEVNVTTEDPGAEDLRKSGSGDQEWGTRVVITDDTFANCGCGGHAWIGSFNDSQDEPVFVYNSSEIGVSAASTLEVGHAVYLAHDGNSGRTYYNGHGSGETGWGPIMGSGYSKNMTTWDNGEYYDANNTGSGANYDRGPDDLGVITTYNGFGYRTDDHGDSSASATGFIGGDSFTYTINDGNGGTDTATVNMTGDGTSATFTNNQQVNISSSGTPRITSTIDVSGMSGTIADVNLGFDISHTWAADLDVSLIAPDGTEINLFTDVGGSGDNFTNTVLDDEAGTAINNAQAPFTGTFRPENQALSTVDGINPNGTWTLVIQDDYSQDGGSLNQWSLEITTSGGSNDDGPEISISDVTVAEGDSGTTTATLQVTLSHASAYPVTVDYATSDGTATEGQDYTAAGGTLQFAPGVTQQTVTIDILGDTAIEGSETFKVDLSNSQTGVLADSQGLVIITDNDFSGEPGTATFGIMSDWGSGFNGTVTVTNTGPAAWAGWTLEFDFDRNLTDIWSGVIVSQTGNHYVVHNEYWNGTTCLVSR